MLLVHIFGADQHQSPISEKSDEEVLKYILDTLEIALFDEKMLSYTCTGRTVFGNEEDERQITDSFQALRIDKEKHFESAPKPVAYLVTLREDDPYAGGSYSYYPFAMDTEGIVNWLVPEPLGTGKNILFFGGEHTVDGREGWQCAHGAANSGIHAAYQILTGDTSEKPILQLYQHLTYLPTLPSGTTDTMLAELKKKVEELQEELRIVRTTLGNADEMKNLISTLSSRLDAVES